LVRAAPFAVRTWAIGGAEGLGYLLSQRLVAAGETVVDVPAASARPRRAGWVGLLRSIARSLSLVAVQAVVMYRYNLEGPEALRFRAF
jgi:hypothetical protein